MGGLKHRQKWQSAKLERCVERTARRRATNQLLRVPWDRFRRAHARYPRWLGFTLWTQAILEVEDRAPSCLVAAVKKRCPGIVNEARRIEPGLLAFRLQERVHNQIFRKAKQGGWLDALIFFGIRDLRSQAIWAYWEHCEKAWERRRPRSYPTFEHWWRTARKWRFCQEASTAQITTALERYLELQAVAYWLDPLLQANRELPATVAAEFERRCPGLLDFSRSLALRQQDANSRLWQRLVGWIEDHYFAEPKKQGWLNIVVKQAHNDPRHVRMVEFWKLSGQNRPWNPAIAYPSFNQWRRAADSYVAD